MEGWKKRNITRLIGGGLAVMACYATFKIHEHRQREDTVY